MTETNLPRWESGRIRSATAFAAAARRPLVIAGEVNVLRNPGERSSDAANSSRPPANVSRLSSSPAATTVSRRTRA